MPLNNRISSAVRKRLRCPICHAKIDLDGQRYVCTNPACGAFYPIVGGVPILLNEASSLFSIADYVPQGAARIESASNSAKQLIGRLTPSIGMNVKGPENYRQLVDLMLRQTNSPRVLVIGGGVLGEGMEAVVNNPTIDIVETDVSIGPRTALICDAHDIPFDDGSFDCVIIQAVLEHVLDPYRCVNEVHRVLNERGLVYAETPFMQQVHMAPYDFTRFTHLGHRRLFRNFEEINSGAVCGPGMALAWSYEHFLLSFSTSKTSRAALSHFAAWTSFLLKYFDFFLINRPGTLDAASGYFFLGRRASNSLPDRELIKLYRGAQRR